MDTLRVKQHKYYWAVIDKLGDPGCLCHGCVYAFNEENAKDQVEKWLNPPIKKLMLDRAVVLHATCLGIECGCSEVPMNFEVDPIPYKKPGRPKKIRI